MRKVVLPRIGFAEAWRKEARQLLLDGVPPEAVRWATEGEADDLFGAGGDVGGPRQAVEKPSVPSAFLPLAEAALCHSGPGRFSLPYRVLWRLQQDRTILADRSDPDVAALCGMEKSVRRAAHKMKAFVRFRDAGASDSGRRRFVAWFEPEHFVLEKTAPFFCRRFGDMDWIIAVPGLLARWQDGELALELQDGRPQLPDDAADDLWRTYYASIFNPARLKVKAMKSEMPVKYWKNLPEAALIPELIASSAKAVAAMQEAAPGLPHPRAQKIVGRLAPAAVTRDERTPETLEEARRLAATCSRCDLCRHATQTVFGEGAVNSDILFVGEQPGDMEDLAGRPFVGPAGKLFDHVLAEAGIDRRGAYITNAVKHFKFEPRGKRRIHKRPDAGEVQRCKWWLDLERRLVAPRLIVALGATAALAVTGNGKDILRRRGTIEIADDGVTPVFLTIHPSAVLRAGNPAEQEAARRAFLADIMALAVLVSPAPETPA